MKTYTDQWNELKAAAMAVFEKLGNKVLLIDKNDFGLPGVHVRNKKKGCANYYWISAVSSHGVAYLDRQDKSQFLKWDKMREADMFYIIEYAFKKNAEAVAVVERYKELLRQTREAFESFVGDENEMTYNTSMKLYFIRAGKSMKLHRIGPWGVMLQDGNGDLYEDDFTYLNMESRCKLVEFLAA